MITVEQLRAQFKVETVAPYGECLVVPESKFEASWLEELKTQGCRVSYIVLHKVPTVLVRPKADSASVGERTVYSPPPKPAVEPENAVVSEELIETIRNPPKPKRNPRSTPNWSTVEDEVLIALRKEGGLTEDEIAAEFVKQFPNRTPCGVHNRINRLIKAGTIEAMSVGRKKLKRKQLSDVTVTQLDLTGHSKRGPGRPPKPKVETQSTQSTPAPAIANPFEIKTTLTLNITVDCSDRQAVANFLEIVKELSGVTKKEASVQ